MARLELILILVLQFEAGISAGPIFLYSRPGQNATLPCTSTSPSDTACFTVSWLYRRDPSQRAIEVGNGFVGKSSVRAVDADCSLVVNKVTAEDAGLYTCRLRRNRKQDDVSVYLSILTVSPPPPAADDPERDGEVTLQCSLLTYSDRPCREKSFRWVDETGAVLLDGFRNSFLSNSGCVSSLTVKRQSGRRYTCRLVDNNKVLTEADYTLDFPGDISAGHIFLYNRPGQDAALPCTTASPSDPTCSTVSWFFHRNQDPIFIEVQNGNVMKSSARAARLSVDTECSLIINTVTTEDVGLYTCLRTNMKQDVGIYLSVLTMSPSPPDADPERDGEVTLVCWLLADSDLGFCPTTILRWVDETGTVLPGKGSGNCVSVMTLKHQSGHNRRYTCQVVENNNVLIEADYTPQFTSDPDPTVSPGWSPLSSVMFSLRIAGLIMMIVIIVLIIRNKRNIKPLDNDNNVNNDVQYGNVEARPAAVQLQ